MAPQKASESAATTTAASLLISSVVIAAAVQYALDTKLVVLASGPPASTKPFATFSEFYPFYLSEHSNPNTKLLHFVGTTILLALMVMEPVLLGALTAAFTVGIVAFPLLRHLSTGAFDMAAIFVTYLVLGRLLTGSWRKTALPMVVAYGFAWAAHFYIQHNRPATFTYPLFSIMGDFRMMAEFVARGFKL